MINYQISTFALCIIRRAPACSTFNFKCTYRLIKTQIITSIKKLKSSHPSIEKFAKLVPLNYLLDVDYCKFGQYLRFMTDRTSKETKIRQKLGMFQVDFSDVGHGLFPCF